MQILPDIEIVDLGLYFVKQDLLALGDVHIGYEEALNKQGILVPRFAFKEMMEKLGQMILATLALSKKQKISTILVNGDLKHEFGKISETEWRHTVRFLKLLRQYTDHIVLVKGNHDKILEPIAKTKGLDLVSFYQVADVLFLHGDVVLDAASEKSVKIIVIGHEHPAVSLNQWPRTEKYKAFLLGKWRKSKLTLSSKRIIVMPSFSLVTEGTDVLKESLLSPFLRGQNLSSFDCFIIGDQSYHFGKLGNLRRRK
ncbi:metallophosphoesterase [Candidatus Woesearchaeota archaeon]|nr:metallophosphoesterase [Candidatus Woesearchaeota archaeon]